MANVLKVTVKEARNLASKDFNGQSDPYCTVVYLSHKTEQVEQEYKSEVINETLNPVWNEEFEFNLDEQKGIVLIEVWDRDTAGKDEYLGRVVLPLDKMEGTHLSGWIALQPGKTEEKQVEVKGDLHVIVDYYTK